MGVRQQGDGAGEQLGLLVDEPVERLLLVDRRREAARRVPPPVEHALARVVGASGEEARAHAGAQRVALVLVGRDREDLRGRQRGEEVLEQRKRVAAQRGVDVGGTTGRRVERTSCAATFILAVFSA